jgi:hypothetical protein
MQRTDRKASTPENARERRERQTQHAPGTRFGATTKDGLLPTLSYRETHLNKKKMGIHKENCTVRSHGRAPGGAQSTGELNILLLNGHTLGVDRAEIRVVK